MGADSSNRFELGVFIVVGTWFCGAEHGGVYAAVVALAWSCALGLVN